MTKAQKFKREYAKELLAVALEDMVSAHALHQAKIARTENIFLFAQQALEKALKAVLCWRDQAIPMVHDIGILVTKVEALGSETPFGYTLNSLTEYATIRRYLEGSESFKSEDIRDILKLVEAAIGWCQQQITSTPP